MEADNEEAEMKKRELIDKANEKNLIDVGQNKKEEEEEDEENKVNEYDEEMSNGGLEDIIEDGEKEKEDNPLIKDEDGKEE